MHNFLKVIIFELILNYNSEIFFEVCFYILRHIIYIGLLFYEFF